MLEFMRVNRYILQGRLDDVNRRFSNFHLCLIHSKSGYLLSFDKGDGSLDFLLPRVPLTCREMYRYLCGLYDGMFIFYCLIHCKSQNHG